MDTSTQVLQPIDGVPLDELCISRMRTLAMHGAVNCEHYGFTIENVKEKAMQLMEGKR